LREREKERNRERKREKEREKERQREREREKKAQTDKITDGGQTMFRLQVLLHVSNVCRKSAQFHVAAFSHSPPTCVCRYRHRMQLLQVDPQAFIRTACRLRRILLSGMTNANIVGKSLG
jgi:hypothetical protein